MKPHPTIRRALISVYDKTGVVEFARALHDEFGIEIISTGGTAKALADAGIPVTLVETLTGCGEMLDGRVKTLHPAIHAAILADRDNPEHMRQLEAAGIKPIDMVVVNLYPFEKTVADPNCTFEQAIEMIDIGGVALLRAAAKNHKHVWTLSEARRLRDVLIYLRARPQGPDEPATVNWRAEMVNWRAEMAWETLWRVSRYDASIASWLGNQSSIAPYTMDLHALFLEGTGAAPPRYGENPHQAVRLLEFAGKDWRLYETSGLPSSYNNYLDADAALGLCCELTRAADGLWHGLWHRRPAGDRCGTGVPPVRGSAWHPVSTERFTRRNLPHIQNPGRTYFVTFRTRDGRQLPPEARDVVLAACSFWHGVKMNVHIAVVMPDHVHLLLTPFLYESGAAIPLGELLHSVKSFTSHAVNKLLRRREPLWLDENFDRIMRNETEFLETWEYVETNAERAGLGSRYHWIWKSDAGFEEAGIVDPSRMPASERRRDHRRDAGATPAAGATADAGATTNAGATPAAGATADAGATTAAGATSGADAGATTAAGAASGADAETRARTAYGAVFVKHMNACGAALDADPIEAYRRAYLADPNAAMGGILAVNFPVDAEFAALVMETYDRFGKPLKEAGAAHAPGGFFVEVWLAPSFTEAAVAIIRGTYDPEEFRRAAAAHAPGESDAAAAAEPIIESPPKKKWGENVRLLAVGDMSAPPDPDELQYRSIAGGMLVQTPDLLGLNEEDWKVVTQRSPSDAEMADLRLAWLICKHTKSNAISIVKDGMLIGNGAGQMSRVMSCRIATWLARENGHADRLSGSAAASDAFFPFPDGPRILIDAGVTALIQPGGSKRDEETIKLCDERGVAMIFTGTRHFRH